MAKIGDPPPKYLSIEGHKDCMGTKDMGTWQAHCVHQLQPQKCKDDAWEQLQQLTGKEKIPSCLTGGIPSLDIASHIFWIII